MTVDFSNLARGSGEVITEPRKIFTTLPSKDKKFSYLRDVQGQVLERWYERRKEKDLIIKMNTGSGKTTVGLLILQSSLREKISPVVYVAPDRFLADQVLNEATLLGVEATNNEDDPGFTAGRKVLVTYVHKLLNGRSRFGVGEEGRKIEIGTLLIDDAHACLETTRDQFKITIPSNHLAYSKILDLFYDSLYDQSPRAALDIRSGDPFSYQEVPFWVWQQKNEELVKILHEHKSDDSIKFNFPLIADVLQLCRYVIGGSEIEIAPTCIPIDVIPSFAYAQRRIYMTATLSDDSVLVTEFNADPEAIHKVITPKTADDLGERMILVPQEVNPDIQLPSIKGMLQGFAKKYNVVVIVPSLRAVTQWKDISDQILIAQNMTAGVRRLRDEHVGLSVLVNKYDGIDLPDGACRILVIDGLPEARSLIQRTDTAALDETEVTLRRQIQRIEQGMGRGVRSNDDHCVVLLVGAGLSRRLHSAKGRKKFTPATKAQLDLSAELAQQLEGGGVADLENVISKCLDRDPGWIEASKRALVDVEPPSEGRLEPSAVALRQAFNTALVGQFPKAAEIIQKAVNCAEEARLKAWLKVRLAELKNFYDPSTAQEILLSAHKQNRQVTRPLRGVGYQKLSIATDAQVSKVIQYRQESFLEHNDLLLWVNELKADLRYSPEHPNQRFERAVADIGRLLGFATQRPEIDFGQGPDGLWALDGGRFLVLECKNRSEADVIAKGEVDQLSGSMNWFVDRYGEVPEAIPVMAHPKYVLDKQASPPEGMRIISEKQLKDLIDALTKFAESLGAPGMLENPKRVHEALHDHGLSSTEFIRTHTRDPSRKGI
ncbi:DEAD/DEAH box helicase family protein [Halorhodospira halophila]|nr:DEAD/DEAH box helicase family protein [Halorhodospira halophila]